MTDQERESRRAYREWSRRRSDETWASLERCGLVVAMLAIAMGIIPLLSMVISW